jgi:hypothetical protein
VLNLVRPGEVGVEDIGQVDQSEQAEQAEQQPQPCGHAQRNRGMGGNGRDRQRAHLAKRVFALAKRALGGVKGKELPPESHPGDQAAEKAMSLGHRFERLVGLAGEQAEIGGTAHDLGVGKGIDQAVE